MLMSSAGLWDYGLEEHLRLATPHLEVHKVLCSVLKGLTTLDRKIQKKVH